ncbi:MAG: hypothetical protein ACRD08_06075 [Acidimicrobiales bacterium]
MPSAGFSHFPTHHRRSLELLDGHGLSVGGDGGLEEHGELERDFCPYANLFCTGEHVDGWRRSAGDPDGQVLTLAQVPALARTAWADIATIR